jgi:hypothetical protein
MSSTYTPPNTCPPSEVPGTRYTISIGWPDGSGIFDYPVSLPEFAAKWLEDGRLPRHVAIWKHCERPSDTGTVSEVHSQLCRLLCFPRDAPPVPDGSPEAKLLDYYKGLKNATSDGSSFWASTPAVVPPLSSGSNGTK